MRSKIYLPGKPGTYENYRKAIEAAGGEVCFNDPYESCHALLLPGGGDLDPSRYGRTNVGSRQIDPTRDAEELSLLETFICAGKPVLGICRGIQVINTFFGGTLLQDITSHSATPEGDRLHAVKTAPSFLQALYGKHCIVNSAHHQAIDRLGEGLVPVQWAQDGIIEAICHRTLPVWAVQWHPERLRGNFLRSDAVNGDALFSWFLTFCKVD